MPSNHELFWSAERFAVVGNREARTFPILTFRGLKNLGKTAIPVDPSQAQVDGETAYDDLASIPGGVEAVVLEVPPEETAGWIQQAAELGVKDVWVHMKRETPEAIALAEEKGINLRTGTCAVMYVTPGFTFHSIHRGLRKLSGNY
ncbi:MAG: CoA-binding protein [Deltaproteobacteria bacterium]|nr:CoA-binding protein [Deltaproteobacteria bacterium]